MTLAQGPSSHPKGLTPLFLTEMWERFCYYGMRALLVLYLVEYQGWEPSQASTVYKWYTSLVYLATIGGGVLADRVVGLRASIIVGGALMAMGEFLLTFSPLPAFYGGLALLIVGNGLFKPNISTIVGKMYRPGDTRRDGAFTIFYMGINLGAGLSPFVCGYLREHYGFRYGFAAAGVGLLVGLAVFVTTQGQILRDVEAAGNDLRVAARDAAAGEDAPASQAGGAEEKAAWLSTAVPYAMLAASVALPGRYLSQVARGQMPWSEAIMPCAIGAIAAWMGLTLLRLRGPARDKSVVIFVLFAFAVLFWMAFEQAGNALNLWAEFHTHLTVGSFRYPAEWWQSVNAAFIVLLAPVFARGWTWLGERGKEPSTPAKMFFAMILMALSFGAMVAGARAEERTTTDEVLAVIPPGVPTRPIAGAGGRLEVGEGDAGRLTFDPATGRLEARGALPAYVVKHVLIAAAPGAFVGWVDRLEDATRGATPAAPVVVPMPVVPHGFELPFAPSEARDKGISWEPGVMTFRRPIESPTRTEIAAAGAPPAFRAALEELARKSDEAKVSGVWLLLSYLFATLGELCLSPVGLSMVTKLAPVRYASVFMGVWMLASSVGQYAGGSIGESWGIITPTAYFTVFVWTSIAGAAILAVLVGPLRRMMHDVR